MRPIHPFKRVVTIAALAVGVTLGAACCQGWKPLEERAPGPPMQASEAFLDAMFAGDIEVALGLMLPNLDPGETRERLEQLASLVGSSPTRAPRLGSYYWIVRGSAKHYAYAYEIEIAKGYVVVALAVEDHDGVVKIVGFQAEQVEHSLIDRHRFALAQKSATHYSFFALAVAIPLFCVACLVICWRQNHRYRLLWLIVILVAAPVVQLNWSTGETTPKLLSLNILGASYQQMGRLNPLLLDVALPIGALAFLVFARPFRKAPVEGDG